MERESVVSSDIASVGYDESTSKLEIQFCSNNSIYQYFDVPKIEYSGLMGAASHGKYFHKNIKNKYRYEKIL